MFRFLKSQLSLASLVDRIKGADTILHLDSGSLQFSEIFPIKVQKETKEIVPDCYQKQIKPDMARKKILRINVNNNPTLSVYFAFSEYRNKDLKCVLTYYSSSVS